MKKQIILLTCCILIIDLIITILIDFSFNLLYFLNTMFTMSLLLTVTGAFMYILQTGFFRPFYQNTKYFFRKINRTTLIADQLERKDNYRKPTIPIKLPFATTLMITGINLTVVTSFISILLF